MNLLQTLPTAFVWGIFAGARASLSTEVKVIQHFHLGAIGCLSGARCSSSTRLRHQVTLHVAQGGSCLQRPPLCRGHSSLHIATLAHLARTGAFPSPHCTPSAPGPGTPAVLFCPRHLPAFLPPIFLWSHLPLAAARSSVQTPSPYPHPRTALTVRLSK